MKRRDEVGGSRVPEPEIFLGILPDFPFSVPSVIFFSFFFGGKSLIFILHQQESSKIKRSLFITLCHLHPPIFPIPPCLISQIRPR